MQKGIKNPQINKILHYSLSFAFPLGTFSELQDVHKVMLFKNSIKCMSLGTHLCPLECCMKRKQEILALIFLLLS